MDNQAAIKASSRFGAFTLAILVMMVIAGLASGGSEPQDMFEFIRDPAVYSDALLKSAPTLRVVLFLDAFFVIGYIGTIGMAAYAFREKNHLAAWMAALGIVAVGALDYAENTYMVQSMDLISFGTISIERIISQSMISAFKWYAAGVAIVALTLIVPQQTWPERILAWFPRIALPLGIALFINNPWGIRLYGMPLIMSAMLASLALLTWVTYKRGNS